MVECRAMAVSMLKRPRLTFPSDVAAFVEERYRSASCILEYGSGGSTVLAAELPNKEVFSVESDQAWAERLSEFFRQYDGVQSRPTIFHVDIGETGKWGYPVNKKMQHVFPGYSCAIWEEMSVNPDLILIDGRFRVSCFLISVALAKKGALVLFDDFVGRAEYDVILKYCEPISFVGRMAEFRMSSGALRGEFFLDFAKYSKDPR